MAYRDVPRLTRPLSSAALVLILVGGLAFAFVAAQERQAPAQNTDERRQPLAFSHRLHASGNAIPCQLCHSYARRGPVAGIPSVQRCVQCHVSIATNRPEIVKLMAYWKDKKPIPWVRVNRLPDYVRFTHKRHVLAGVACETCHGDVGQMRTVVQTAAFTMGFCLSCHKERQAPTDCLVCHH